MELQRERKNGRIERKRTTKIEVIGRMLRAHLSIELIKECTNATDEEIEEVKKLENKI